MSATTDRAFARGYQEALSDIARQLREGALPAVEAWLANNRRTVYGPGDRVYRYWDARISMDVQPLTVVRANRLTVTVRTDQGNEFRLPYADIVGYYGEES